MSNLERISKVSRKTGELTICMSSTDGESDRETIIKSRAAPHPDLIDAFKNLEPHMREILELPSSVWRDAVTITGVSFSHSEDTGVEGAVITFQAELPETSTSPFCSNTPHLPFDQYSEGGNAMVMPPEAVDDLEHLRREAKRFLEGKRLQGDLFAPDGKAAAAGEGREPTPIGELTDKVVEVVDAVIQEELAKPEKAAKPKKGERTGKSNVVFLGGTKPKEEVTH